MLVFVFILSYWLVPTKLNHNGERKLSFSVRDRLIL